LVKRFRKYFTPEEANKLLPVVKPIVFELVIKAKSIQELTGKQRNDAIREIERLVYRIEEMGIEVKDLATGLLDFPASRFGEDVLLCWKLGEEEVSHWHNLRDGFRGRKPLKPEVQQIR
jgi:hypothetical protein